MALHFPRAVLRANDWRARAVCRDADPEIFFPTGEPASRYDPRNREALDCCAVCPVVAQCLEFALDAIPYGIAGGMTASERAKLSGRRHYPVPDRDRVRDQSAPSEPGSVPRAVARSRGITLLINGVRRQDIARACGVDQRTVDRWAARPEVAPRLRERAARDRAPLNREQARRAGSRRVS